MRINLTNEQLTLADLMSDISERCYCAGWMQDLEYNLWDAVINGQRKYGQDIITENDIGMLLHLSNTTNSWIIFDDETEETAIDLQVWKEMFQKDIHQNPKLLSR